MKHFVFFFCWVMLTACGSRTVIPDKQAERCPVLFPDYTDVTFPVNIAPPNCRIMEEGDVFQVEVGADDRVYYQRKSKSPDIRIPLDTWRLLTKENSGKNFFVRVAVRKAGEWMQYKAIQNRISTDSISWGLSMSSPTLLETIPSITTRGLLLAEMEFSPRIVMLPVLPGLSPLVM